MKKSIYIVIAAYNEEQMVGKVIDDLKKANYRNIVVVDDCSKDRTGKLAEKNGAVVLRHVINLGQGAALQTGMDWALEKGADIIVTFDADGQHQAKDVRSMIEPIIKGEVDVTLGSRFLHPNVKIPKLRRIYYRIGIIVLFVMYGIKLTDAHNGFRAFSRGAAKKISIRSNRMEHASEIPEQIKKNKLRFKEVPVHIKYTEYSLKHGQNYKTNAFKIFYKMIVRKLLR